MRSCSPKTYEQFHASYSMLKQLGHGNFGKVYSIRDNFTHEYHAVKVISCTCQRDVQEAEQEIQILERLDHPHIVKIIQAYRQNYVQSHDNPLCNFSIVIELGVCSLQDVIWDPHYYYDLADVRRFLANLIDTGAYLESLTFVHRDIKPGNIIIFGEHLDFKLADFGLSCKAHERPNYFAGTLDYSSPMLQEYHRAKLANRKHISNAFKDDVYSVGLTVNKVLENIGHKWRMKSTDPLIQKMNSILSEMLQVDQRNRPTFLDLMKSEFIHEELQRTQSRPSKHVSFREAIPELEREKEPQTVRKIIANPLEYLHIPTFVEKPSYQIKEYFYDIDYSVRAVCRINGNYILCGDEQGRLIVFDCFVKESYVLTVQHQRYVARIMLDEAKNIWTAGGDGLIYLFTLETLLHCIKNNKFQESHNKSIFYNKQVTHKVKINIDQDNCRIVHRSPPNKYIITFQCFNDRQFVVAYADGSIYVHWNGKQTNYFSSLDVVTNIQIVRDKVYTSFYKGAITRFDLKTFTWDSLLFSFKDRVVNFKVEQDRDTLNIEAVTYNGNLQTIKVGPQIHNSFNQEIDLNNILGACFYEDMWFLLSRDGKICPKGKDIIQCPKGKGWNCLEASSQGLVGASFEGMLVVLELQLL